MHMLKKIMRDTSTDAKKAFWKVSEEAGVTVQDWPSWRRAGINVCDQLDTPRSDAIGFKH